MQRAFLLLAILATPFFASAGEQEDRCPRDSSSMLTIVLKAGVTTTVIGPEGDRVFIPGDAAAARDRVVRLRFAGPSGPVVACLTAARPDEMPPLQIVLREPTE